MGRMIWNWLKSWIVINNGRAGKLGNEEIEVVGVLTQQVIQIGQYKEHDGKYDERF